MAVNPPTRGQRDWDDEMNNILQSLDSGVQAAASKADVAASDAAYARNRADEVHTAVLGGTDAAVSGFINDDTSATKASLSATYARPKDIAPKVTAPLAIPTYDGNPAAAHPSVVLAPDNTWNGYRYWMAFTPYPTEPRENPSIVASNDGINWEVPDGLSNPVVPLSYATAQGYSYGSDTHLVFNGSTLVMFFRLAATSPSAKEAIYRCHSTDGVTWSTPVQLFANATTATADVSPAVVIDADGTWRMWTVDARVSNVPILRMRTSADGLTWGAPSNCTHANGTDPWHIDVQAFGGKYHALIYDKTAPDYLNYLTSADGLTWDGTTAYSLPKSGLTYDAGGFYRSCMVARPGNPVTWDLWVNGRNVGSTDYRIGYVPAFDWNKAIEDYKRQSAEAAVTKRNRALVVDSFSRRSANGIGKPEVGTDWTWYPGAGGGNPSISNGRLLFPANSTNAALLSAGAANGRASVELYLPTAQAGLNADAGIAFRATDNANTLFVSIYHAADNSINRVSIWKRQAGAATKLAEVLSVGLIRGAYYDLAVTFKGDKITAFLDGASVLTHTLSAGDMTTFGSNTKVGLWGPASTPATFANFVCRYA